MLLSQNQQPNRPDQALWLLGEVLIAHQSWPVNVKCEAHLPLAGLHDSAHPADGATLLLE